VQGSAPRRNPENKGATAVKPWGSTRGERKPIKFKDAVILGLTQGLAIAPGVSRSGITISTLLFRGFDRELSFNFSFLAAIPAICAAGLLEAREINFALKGNFNGFLVGFIFSFIVGLFALWFLKRIMQQAKLYYFGYYCLIVGALTLFFLK
jgi:undecaprenyl-diphosphatase